MGSLRSLLGWQFGDYCLGIETAEAVEVELVVEVVEEGCELLALVVE